MQWQSQFRKSRRQENETVTNLILPHDPVPLFLSLSLLTPAPGPCTGLPKVQHCRVETTELGRSRPETDKTERTGETGRKKWSSGTRLLTTKEWISFVRARRLLKWCGMGAETNRLDNVAVLGRELKRMHPIQFNTTPAQSCRMSRLLSRQGMFARQSRRIINSCSTGHCQARERYAPNKPSPYSNKINRLKPTGADKYDQSRKLMLCTCSEVIEWCRVGVDGVSGR